MRRRNGVPLAVSCSRFVLKMLYLYCHVSSPWVKFGFTNASSPWQRIREGFWTNAHPSDLCGRLGPEQFALLNVWEGDVQLERVVQELFPDRVEEFWPAHRAAAIVDLMNLMAEPIQIPPRPVIVPQCDERLPCCGGKLYQCHECRRTFPRSIKLWQHIEDVHRETRVRCGCGAEVIPRNLPRHRETGRCKRARAQ